MSYEILYGRQFLDLNNGTYIPMILSGSNNCSMFSNGREIRERHWWAYGTYGHSDRTAKTKDEWIQWMQERVEGNPEVEWFMRGSKWLLGKDMVRWMESGIKSARTIEEIIQAVPYQSLHCFVTIYDKSKDYTDPGYSRREREMFIHSSKELVHWIDEFEEMKKTKKETEEVCKHISFSGIEPLGIGFKSAVKGAVICKVGNGYLKSFQVRESGSQYSLTPDASNAIVFESEEDFSKKTEGLYLRKRKLIKANQPSKNFVIRIASGGYTGQYVSKMSRSKLHMTGGKSTAKKFTTRGAAEKYIKDMLEGRIPACKEFEVAEIA